jgi:sporulation protein YlmC with PRC-barrel domain
MSKIHMTAAVALALAAATPAAYAQSAANHETRVVATNTTLPHSLQTDEIRASKMIGSAVYDVQNRKIGSVADVILNKDGKIDAVVVDVGSFLGMGGKYVAVPPGEMKTDNNRLTLDRTKEQLQQMASYDLENRNTGAGTSTSPVEGGRLNTPSGR